MGHSDGQGAQAGPSGGMGPRAAFAILPLGAALAVLLLGLTAGSDPVRGETGCQAVPAAYAEMKNPVELPDNKVFSLRSQFRGKCARCHGEKADGGGDDSSQQKFPPASFTDKGFMAQCSDGQLFYQILVGGEDRSAMPGFGPGSAQGWSEEKVWQMVAFLRRIAEKGELP